MASPTVRRSPQQPHATAFPWRVRRFPLLPRRCGAWLIEVSLIVASAAVPFSLGNYVKSQAISNLVPLNPLITATQTAIAQPLAIPISESDRSVPPLTNLLWSGAIIAPVVVVGLNLYLLGKTGQTQAKRWLGVRVVTGMGTPPGLGRALVREGVGRWGLPLGIAYTIWRYSGAFPDLGILAGLAGCLVLGESFSARFLNRRRAWHDRLAGTTVVDAAQPMPAYTERVQVLWRGQGSYESTNRWIDEDDAIAAIVLAPEPHRQRPSLWAWMRQNPGLTLLVVSLSSIALVLGTFAGTQVYVQSQANRREFKQQDNEVFLALVSKLAPSIPNAPDERRSAILALGTVNDSRATPLLVDLLGQEDAPNLIDALQQALVSRGPDALPYLQRLNQSLQNDLVSLRYGNNEREYRLIALRRRATQRAIAKLLTIYSGNIHNADLSRVDLGQVDTGSAQFTLVLSQIDLSGVKLQGSSLVGANLQNSRFYGPGADERWDTFDDWTTDLSHADLKDANLTNTLLSNSNLEQSSLIRAILNKADLSKANLLRANLSSASLIAANLNNAVLERASLIGADLGNADLSHANLQAARLGQASATTAKFTLANLAQTEWQGADLSGADFHNANLKNADLRATKLVGATLRGAQLQNASLRNADLSQADLRGANVEGADFQGAIFKTPNPADANQFIQPAFQPNEAGLLKGTNFTNAKNLKAQQIEYICAQGGQHPQCR
jgi:uncharacterized protein YjbI with pentapeptide repeats/uncharacterized RDD family membrane protein YckC